MGTEELLNLILNISSDFKAVDMRCYKVDHICNFADYFVIMTGTSSTHIQALSEELLYKCKHADRQASGTEGVVQGEWSLLDFGDIVVHIMTRDKRDYYNLEEMWADAEEISVDHIDMPFPQHEEEQAD